MKDALTMRAGAAETVPRPRVRTTPRAVALVVHRWVGLALTGFLVVVGLTGSVLAFEQELDALFAPSLLRADPPAAGARPRDVLLLREAVATRLPEGARASYVPLTVEEGRAASFYVTLPPGAEGDDQWFVDPYTGEVLGSRRWGDLRQGVVNLVPFLYRLHYALALDEVGTTLLGVVALLWTLDCFVGAYLTFPAGRRRATGRGLRASWLGRWLASWTLNTTKRFALVFTWHRASGLWVWGMLFVFAWSGVGLNLSGVYDPVMRALTGMEPRLDERLPSPHAADREPALAWSEARAAARRHLAAEAAARGFAVLGERRMSHEPTKGLFRYQARTTLDVSDRFAGTTVYVDDVTGAFVAFEAPTGENAGRTFTNWIYHLHFGSIAGGGVPYRAFVSLMGVAVAALAVTGAWIWARKRTRRGGRGARPAHGPD